VNSVKCPVASKFCGGYLEFTSVAGKVVESCARCDRRRAGICRDCPALVEGYVGKAIRCARCKILRRRENERDRMKGPVIHARKNARYRKKWRTDAAFRERRRRQRKAWMAANPAKVKAMKRRYLLKQPAAYLATQRKWNRDPVRIAKNRAASKAKYYELHPVRPDPHCSRCGVKIDWNGKCRPRLTCDNCCTAAELRRRRGEYNKRAYLRRRTAA